MVPTITAGDPIVMSKTRQIGGQSPMVQACLMASFKGSINCFKRQK
jgi:hypothetical protein